MNKLITKIYRMKSNKKFVNTLEDNVRKWGDIDKFISNGAQVEIINKVK